MQAVHRKPRSLDELIAISGKSRASTFRALADIRDQIHAELHNDEADGKYRLHRWGIIDKTALPAFHDDWIRHAKELLKNAP